jgi:hypothetical protein
VGIYTLSLCKWGKLKMINAKISLSLLMLSVNGDPGKLQATFPIPLNLPLIRGEVKVSLLPKEGLKGE